MTYITRDLPSYLYAGLSADQTSNLGANNHVEFDTAYTVGTKISLATGAGQANGLFTLAAGTYEIRCWIDSSENNGIHNLEWRDNADDSIIQDTTSADNPRMYMPDPTSAHDTTPLHSSSIIVTLGSSTTIKLDIIAPGSITQWNQLGTRVLITEIV